MLGPPPVDGGPDGAPGDRIHSGRRLVQHQDGAFTDQRRGEAGEPALPAGQLLDRPPGEPGEPELLQYVVTGGAGLPYRHAPEASGGLRGERHGEFVEGGGFLAEVADQPRGPLGVAHEVVSQHLDASGVGTHQAGQLAYEGGLARAVGSEQSEDLPAPDVETDPVGGAYLGSGRTAASAAHGGVGLDQVTHRAHGAGPRLCCARSLCCARTHEV